MKVKEKKLASGKLLLEVEANEKDVGNALQLASVAFAESMGLQPQAGKTVAEVAEERMGIKDLDSMVEQSAIEALVPFALDKKNIVALFPPKPQHSGSLRRGAPFAFTLEVTPKPAYELTSYDPVEITVPPFTIPEGAVDDQLKQMASGYTAYVSADPKPVEKGDCCLIAMECFEDGEPLKGLTTEGRTYVAGEGYMPKGFDEQIIGMSPGETKTFTFEGPSVDANMNEIVQKVDCTVTVKEIQKAVTPTIDDAWVKMNMPFYKSAQELRDSIAASLEQQGREEYGEFLRQAATVEAAKRFEGSIADEAYEAMRDTLVESIRAGLQQEGKTWEQFIEENGGEQQFGMMLMLQVRQFLVQRFALDAVYRHEKLSLTDEDIERAIHAMSPQANPKAMRKQMEGAGHGTEIREAAERMKAAQWLVDHAIVTELEG